MHLLWFKNHIQTKNYCNTCESKMIQSVIKVVDKQNNLSDIFASEEQKLLNNRASYTIDYKNKKTIFTINAKDATALRAVLNSICKTLIVFEKTSEIIKND